MSCQYCKADCVHKGEQQKKECRGYIPMTNADRIRAMSDEELANFMAERNVNESTLLSLNEDHSLTATQIKALKHRIYCACMQWLKHPAEDYI